MASKKRKSSKKGASPPKKSTPDVQKITSTTPRAVAKPSLFWGVALLIAVVTGVVYKGALDNDFVDWDDYKYVIHNDLVRSTADIQAVGNQRRATPSPLQTTLGDVFSTSVALNYHPLTVLTLRWNNNADLSNREGISPRPFILWNLILHVLNSLLVLLLIYRLSKKNLWASAVVALIFALHPMHVESVAWVSERKDVLYSFFFLSGLLSYWNYLETGAKKWFWGAFALFVSIRQVLCGGGFSVGFVAVAFLESSGNAPKGSICCLVAAHVAAALAIFCNRFVVWTGCGEYSGRWGLFWTPRARQPIRCHCADGYL